MPEFDLEVAAQNETPYKTMEYNQLALQLFQMGFFRADMAEQALRCLDLMEFKNKDQLAAVIRQGRQRTQQVEWLQGQLMTALRLLDARQGSQLAEELAREVMAACEEPSQLRFLYPDDMPLRERVERTAREL